MIFKSLLPWFLEKLIKTKRFCILFGRIFICIRWIHPMRHSEWQFNFWSFRSQKLGCGLLNCTLLNILSDTGCNHRRRKRTREPRNDYFEVLTTSIFKQVPFFLIGVHTNVMRVETGKQLVRTNVFALD